jgi:hypothetical protein
MEQSSKIHIITACLFIMIVILRPNMSSLYLFSKWPILRKLIERSLFHHFVLIHYWLRMNNRIDMM